MSAPADQYNPNEAVHTLDTQNKALSDAEQVLTALNELDGRVDDYLFGPEGSENFVSYLEGILKNNTGLSRNDKFVRLVSSMRNEIGAGKFTPITFDKLGHLRNSFAFLAKYAFDLDGDESTLISMNLGDRVKHIKEHLLPEAKKSIRTLDTKLAQLNQILADEKTVLRLYMGNELPEGWVKHVVREFLVYKGYGKYIDQADNSAEVVEEMKDDQLNINMSDYELIESSHVPHAVLARAVDHLLRYSSGSSYSYEKFFRSNDRLSFLVVWAFVTNSVNSADTKKVTSHRKAGKLLITIEDGKLHLAEADLHFH